MKQPLVSILIPCYNAEPWIQQCIQSALDQTYPLKEVIVVDDGSTDASVEIIESFGERVRFHKSPHSGGNVARNRLTNLAHGEWLQYLDADDYLRPNKIAGQVATIDNSVSDVDVIYSPVVVKDFENSGMERVVEITDADEILTFIEWAPFNTGGLLLKRETVLRVGGWKEDQECCQEHELLLRLRIAGCRFLLHDKAETVYRRHSSGTVSRRDPVRVIHARMELTDRMDQYLEASGQMIAAYKDALFAARMECARSAYRFMNMPLAQKLSKKASAHGHRWISGSPAVPLRYQIALRLAGFETAERLADWARTPQVSVASWFRRR